jgi:SET domain
MEVSKDPFAVFGDNSDDDEPVDRTIINKPLKTRVAAPTTVDDRVGKEAASTPEEDASDVTTFSPLDLPWQPPLYMAPEIQVVSSLGQFGGQRGFIATQRISPGTLLLVEEPVVAWSDYDVAAHENVHDALLDIFERNFLTHPNLPQLLQDMEYLHPTKAIVESCLQSSAPPDAIDWKEQIYDPIQELQLHYENSDRIQHILEYLSSLSTRDIFRLLLVLRYNGLETGLYLYAAMLNHAAAPNCVKFRPSRGVSEVRATRTIARHTPLTISYVPRVLARASRRRYLWRQHRFDIRDAAAEDRPGRSMELMGLEWPISPCSSRENSSDDSITSRVEASIAELESLQQDIIVTEEDFRGSTALEQRCWEFLGTLEGELQNKQHILWIPARSLHVNICSGLLACPISDHLSFFERMAVLQRLVASAEHLRDLQRQLLGPDHFDIAQTNLDLVQAVEELMSRSPRHLRDLWPSDHVSAWSAQVFQIRFDYERIKALYPENVNDFIETKKVH